MHGRKAFGPVVAIVACRRAGLLRTTALQAVAAFVFIGPALAQPAPGARPMGGVIVGGVASIGQTAAATTVTQASQRAAIDWRSFDVGRDHVVQFQQPNSSAVVLNRVIGPNPSSIAGRIQANGQVVITNQSGVVFHKGAQVETAGLVVSAAGISTPNFMAGRMAFDIAPRPDAEVSNAGTITVRQAGLAALVAPRVANSGVINAAMGRVVLAGAVAHTVDLYGDGLLSIDVTGQVRRAPRGADGKPVTALVTNTGVIVADGGTIQLTAAAADGIVQTLVQAGGRLQANIAGGRPGTVVVAGVGGSVRIEGRVAADGDAPGATGGTVVATASGAVTVAAPARITANGVAGGGTVAIGATTARARDGSGPAAKTVTVEAGARIEANARRSGNGGRVTVAASGTAAMGGAISARGGSLGGDGGVVELSAATLGLTGPVDAGAPAGKLGQVLLDPTDITISKTAGPGVVTPQSLELLTGNVTVQADRTITAVDSVKLAGTNNGAGQSLTLDAGASITIDATATLDVSGGLTLKAGLGGVSLLGSVHPRGPQGLIFNTAGAVIQSTASVITTGPLSGTVGSAALTSRLNQIALVETFAHNSLTASAGDISIVSSIPLEVGPGFGHPTIAVPTGRTISLTADDLTIGTYMGSSLAAPGGTIAIQPFTAGHAIEVKSTFSEAPPPPKTLVIPSGAIQELTTATLSLGSGTTGAVKLASDGVAIDFGRPGITTLRVQSGAGVAQVGAIKVANFTGDAPTIALGAANTIPNVGPLTATGDIAINTVGSLAVNGAVFGPGKVSLSSGGDSGKLPPTMTINADLRGGTVALDTTQGNTLALFDSGTIRQSAGVINASVLTGKAASATLDRQNQIAAVGDFATDNGLALTSAGSMVLVGALSNNAGVMRLSAGGVITQAAGSTITTPTLSGSAGAAGFTSAGNLVGALQDYTTTAGNLALTTRLNVFNADSLALSVLAAAAVPTIPLVLGGTISVPAGRSIAIIADRVTTTAGTIISAPAGTVSFAPLDPARNIEAVATAAKQSAAALSLTQADLAAITTGTLQLGSASSTGAIALGAPGDAIDLTGHAATLDVLTSGAVSQGGASATLIVPTLTGNAASITLPNLNQIGTLGRLTTAGAVTVNSGASLSVTGPVSAGGAAALSTAGAMTLSGDIAAPGVQLSAGAPGISQTAGTVATPGTLQLATTGPVAQAAGASIAAGTLAGNGGAVTLTSTANQVANLGPFVTTGDLTLGNGRSLTVAGPIRSHDIALTVGGDLSLNATVIGNSVTLNVAGALTENPGSELYPLGGAIYATVLRGTAATARLDRANSIAALADFASSTGFTLSDGGFLDVTGTVTDNALVALTSRGPITVSGNIAAPTVTLTALPGVRPPVPSFILQSSGSITAVTGLRLQAIDAVRQTGGTIATGQLSGASGGVTQLDQSANQIAGLGGYSSVGGFGLRTARGLVQAGALTDTKRIDLAVAGPLSLAGTVSAPTVTLAAPSVTQSQGVLAANTLNIAANDASLTNGLVDNLGTVQVPGGFRLVDGAALRVGGPVNAGTLDLSGGGVTFAGPVTVGTLRLANGGVQQSGGALQAGSLSGSATADVSLGVNGTAAIGSLAGFTAGGSFQLNNLAPLLVTGPVRAPRLAIGAPGSITLQGGGVSADSADITVNGPGGQLIQTGTTSVAPLGTSVAQLRLTVQGGSIALQDLAAPNASVTLAMGSGRATGNLVAGSLLVSDQGGGASLSGTVAGRTGFDAALVSNIVKFDPAYTINGCAIASITCGAGVPVVRLVVASTVRPDVVPMASVLRPDLFTADLITLELVRDPADPDFALPNISDRDY